MISFSRLNDQEDLLPNNSTSFAGNNLLKVSQLVTKQFLAKKNTVMILQYPCFSNMLPSDFFRFLRLKST